MTVFRCFDTKTFLTAVMSSAIFLNAGPALANGLEVSYSEQDQIAPCVAGEGDAPRALVDVHGLQSTDGQIRVQIYSDNPDEFLVSGAKVTRVDVPTLKDGQKVCVTLPKPGTYSMAVLHDKNENGRADIFTEGFGFSNNPRLLFGPPEHEETLFSVDEGVKTLEVSLTYYFQLENKDQKRRRRH